MQFSPFAVNWKYIFYLKLQKKPCQLTKNDRRKGRMGKAIFFFFFFISLERHKNNYVDRALNGKRPKSAREKTLPRLNQIFWPHCCIPMDCLEPLSNWVARTVNSTFFAYPPKKNTCPSSTEKKDKNKKKSRETSHFLSKCQLNKTFLKHFVSL